MSRTELQAEIIRALEAVQVLPDRSRRAPVAARMVAKRLGVPVQSRAEFARGFTSQLEGCFRDGVTSQGAVSGRVADWIQEQVQP